MTDLRFDGRVAVVTGAGGGLGKQHALLLASRGARVVVNDVGGSVTGEGSDNSRTAAVVAEIRDRGGEAIADVNTVATPEGGQAVIRTALEAYGRIDILVNNAGILRDKEFEEMTSERLEPVVDVHLRGAFHVTRPAWIAMQERSYGRVVNTTSASGILGSGRQSNYGAVKGGLVGLTRVLAAEGAKHNIKVNAIAPTAYTRMLTYALAEVKTAGTTDPAVAPFVEQLEKTFSDLLDPALVSPVVALLAHENCPVTGEIYSAGGGQVSRFFIGRTPGYYNPRLSIEDVHDHLAEIRDETGYTVPADSMEEIAALLATIESQQQKAH
jgi:NAD(P)-dependent dehydrogenase (short-subunit alcohol dehydrogenase family)